MNDHYGVCEWLRNSGFVIMAHNCPLQLPLSGNIEEGNFRMYFSDTSLLFASMDDEAQMMIRKNNDFSIYNGAIYESIIAAELKK